MDDARLVAALEDALAKLGVPLRVEPLGTSRGALVVVKGAPQVLLPEHATTRERIAVLAAALARLDTSSLFLAPAVRAAIDRYPAG